MITTTASGFQRNATLDVLRGVAAMSVAWYHFTNGNPKFLASGLLKASGTYGWLGVEMFFVISGFIIPLTLMRSGYRIADYRKFLVKRIVRLDPPYIVALVLIIALGYLSSAVPGFQGRPFHASVPQVLLHLGYLNVFFGYAWLNPVFWTLAVELQYYLLIGLLVSWLASPNDRLRWGTMVLLVSLAVLLPDERFVFHWLALFLMGIATFQLHYGLASWRQFVVTLACLAAAGAPLYGVVVTAVGLTTAAVIATVRLQPTNPLVSLGHLSYSLYLLHSPIGGRVVNFSLRHVNSNAGKFAVVVAALGSSLLAAWLLYRAVERPAQRWSSAIRYSRGSPTVGPTSPVANDAPERDQCLRLDHVARDIFSTSITGSLMHPYPRRRAGQGLVGP